MTQNILIGEAVLDINVERLEARYIVEPMDGRALGAPINSRPDYSNQILPPYLTWANFCKEAELDFSEAMKKGIKRLSKVDLIKFKDVDRRKFTRATWDKARLNYLIFWTGWALEHCNHPAICFRDVNEAST